MQPSAKPRRFHLRYLVLLLVAIGAIAVVPNLQLISDTIAAHGVELSPAMLKMKQRIGLTKKYDVVMRASRPLLQDKQDFNRSCPRKEATAYILGCYNGRQIFVYHVTDPELDGASEVTLAHEFLHAVYARLSLKERRWLEKVLTENYNKVKTTELTKRMEMYNRTQPGEFINELHSILGTEFDGLTDELETYYKRYFTDRKAIVAMKKKYHKSFTDKETKAKQLEQQVNAKKKLFEAAKKAYEENIESFNQAVLKFNQRAKNGDFDSESQFRQERQILVEQQNSLQRQKSELELNAKLINQLVEQYNQTALALRKLSAGLDSLSKTPSVRTLDNAKK